MDDHGISYVPRSEYMERVARIDDKISGLDRRLEKAESMNKEINNIALSVQRMVSALENIQKEQTEQGERLKKIEEEPADNWKKFTWLAFTTVVAFVMGVLLARLGL